MPSPILLTGSAGFVGRTIAPLLRLAFPDRPLVRLVRHAPAPDGGEACDLAVREPTEAMMARVRPGIVIHLAANSSVGLARTQPSAVWRDNLNASLWVARAVAKSVPEATVLLTSTAEVYGRALNDGPADETTPPRPSGPYASSKLASEHVFMEHLPASARLIVARPFNHTGPGQTEHFAIPSFAAQVARIEAGRAPPVIRVGNLSARRDFLHVADVAEAYVRLVAVADQLGPRDVINVAQGTATSLHDVLDMLIGMARVPVAVEVDPARLRANDIPVATARTDRIRSLMDWPPVRPLAEMLADVLDDKRRAVASSRR